MPPANGQEGVIWDPCGVHDHGSARAERVYPNVFEGKFMSGRAHSTGIGPEDGYNGRDADGADPLSCGIIFVDWGGNWAPVLSNVEEDVDPHLDWAGRWGL